MIRMSRPFRSIIFSAMLVSLAACSSGSGSGDGGGNRNIAPTASAGDDQNVIENAVIQLNGSGSDPDAADRLTYSWAQVSGTAVTINNADMAQADFVSPNVAANTPETLTFRLTVTDLAGSSGTDDVDIVVSEPALVVTISGILQYEFPTPASNCDGLNFDATTLRPIRGATVQLVEENGGAVLASIVSDNNGAYSFQTDGQGSVLIRVRAELKRTGNPSWDVEVRDNTSDTGVPLAERPLYVLDGPASSPGGADEVRNLLATHDWNGNGFTGARSAAPFSVLDAIYTGMQLILSADAQAIFPPMDAFWSVNNTQSEGVPRDVDIGELSGAFYDPNISSLFLRGKDGVDIDEFDHHVIVHEWSHYFDHRFSRSDSIGGTHRSGDRLDARVAFGEGFAYALAGMALNSTASCDSFWFNNTLRGGGFSLESQDTSPNPGWYNEESIVKVVYDLWDTNVDGTDSSSIGFGPIYDVMTGAQTTTEAFTSIFSFAEAIKAAGTGKNPFIDALLEGESITAAGVDRWGSTETNNAGSTDTLPVYTTIQTDGTPLNVCSNSEFDSVGPDNEGNKLNEHRYLRMTINTQQRYTFDIQADAATLALMPIPDDLADERDQSDPDMFYYRVGQIQNLCLDGPACNDPEGLSGDANVENFTSFNPLPVGEYVIDFNDFRFNDTETDPAYPTRTCFDITVTPAP